jgi:hypothetical protein
MEMKFLREILGKTRRDKIKNDDIREQLKVDDIKYDIERNRLKSCHAHGRREDTKEDAGDEVEGKKTKRQAKKQVDGPSNERCRKEGEEMDAGETRQGMGRQGKGTDGDFFVTVDPRNWKRLKEEEEEGCLVSAHFQSWRTTLCQLSADAYVTYLQLITAHRSCLEGYHEYMTIPRFIRTG